MFSLTSMSNALHNSQLDFAALDAERRIAERENFFIGGMIPRVEQGLNYAWRPFKLAGAFIVNVDKKEPPAPPVLPEEFRNTELGTGVEEGMKLEVASIACNAKARECAIKLDRTGYQRNSSLAAFNDAKQRNVVMAEERTPVGTSSSIFSTAAIGGLVANIPENIKADIGNNIIGKARALLA